MTEATTPPASREKAIGKIPPQLRQELKIHAAIRGVEMQDAVEEAINAWLTSEDQSLPEVATSGAITFGTYLPDSVYSDFRKKCTDRSVSATLGLAQALVMWIGQERPVKRFVIVRRLIVCNQKGGVGKTSSSAAVAQALAELGYRVLLVDFDPQGHLTAQLGGSKLAMDHPNSLTRHMVGKAAGNLMEIVVPVPGDRFRNGLFLLPSCADAFLLDAQLATLRGREYALAKALRPLEENFDIIVVDCPPSLGIGMDAALQYAGRRDGEEPKNSGILIPVEAEDSSADAYTMLIDQIESVKLDLGLEIYLFGLLVNKYSIQKGYIATSSLEAWESLPDTAVLGIFKDLKEQREAVRLKQPLLDYAPGCELSTVARSIARKLVEA